MSIINAHVHMIEIKGAGTNSCEDYIPAGVSVYENIEDSLSMLLPKTVLCQMEEAGIAKSILYAVNAPIVYASNEYVKKLCDMHPDRFIGFASVDPFASDAAKTLEHAVTKMGFKGLKLHPPLQNFYPNDERVFGIYEKAIELNIPVVFHVGTTPFGAMCKLDQANPILLDDVACRFPDLRIMLTHLGTLWHSEAFMVVEKHPNVFIDTAAYIFEIRQLLDMNLIKRLGAKKIIFGTDYPSPFADEPHRMKDFVDCISSLGLPDEILQGIFYDNVQILLKGRDHEPTSLSVGEIMAKLSAYNKDEH